MSGTGTTKSLPLRGCLGSRFQVPGSKFRKSLRTSPQFVIIVATHEINTIGRVAETVFLGGTGAMSAAEVRESVSLSLQMGGRSYVVEK